MITDMSTDATPSPQGAAQPVSGFPQQNGDGHGHDHGKAGFAGLTLGSVGVVYGDIGTSPLYALKESLHHTAKDGIASRIEVIGVVSLLIWALVIVVTLKYVVFIMRADNKGEGGTLSLMALAQTKMGRNMGPVFFLGVIGAALFYGDSIITPAISVLSAVEGLKQIDARKARRSFRTITSSCSRLSSCSGSSRCRAAVRARWRPGSGPSC
jgi:KUP system potassium uptake protein